MTFDNEGVTTCFGGGIAKTLLVSPVLIAYPAPHTMNSLVESPEIRDALQPMSVDFYHAASEMGWIDEDIELLEGFPIKKMSKSPEHEYLVQRLLRLLESVIGPGRFVVKERPLTCADSEPEPDLMVVVGEESSFRRAHPRTADLVVEVSIHTLDRDRRKAAIYAAAGVSEYWIVDPGTETITRHLYPRSSGYGESLAFTGDSPLESASVPGFRIVPAELFA